MWSSKRFDMTTVRIEGVSGHSEDHLITLAKALIWDTAQDCSLSAIMLKRGSGGHPVPALNFTSEPAQTPSDPKIPIAKLSVLLHFDTLECAQAIATNTKNVKNNFGRQAEAVLLCPSWVLCD